MRERADRRVFPMKVNPDLFFKFHDGKFVVWNFRAHEQFELTLPYFQRLYEIATSGPSAEQLEPPLTSTGIDDELRAAALAAPNFPDAQWGWDSLSYLFHIGTQSLLGANLPRED